MLFLLGTSCLVAQQELRLRITADFRGVPLAKALQELEQEYGLGFNYLTDLVAGKTVHCRFRNAGWPEVAECLLERHGLVGSVPDRGYVSIKSGIAAADIPLTELTSVDLPSVSVTEYVTDGITAAADGREVRIAPAESPPVPGVTDGELSRMLTLLPGVVSRKESAGDLSIRGGTRDQNLFLWDGIPVYSSGHYFGMIANFSPELVRSVRVWRGRADAAYGGRVAGVVQLETDPEVTQRTEAGGGISLLQTDAFLKMPLLSGRSDLQIGVKGNLPLQLSGPAYVSLRNQQFQASQFARILEESDQEGIEETFAFREINARWQYRLAQRQRLTVSGFWQRDRYDYRLGALSRSSAYSDRLNSRNGGVSVRYRGEFSGGRRLGVEAALTDFDNNGSTNFTEGRAELADIRASGIREASVRLRYRLPLFTVGQLEVGGQWQAYRHRSSLRRLDILRDRERRFVRNGQTGLATAFATYAWQPRGRWAGELGLRLPCYGTTEKIYAEPRISGSYRLGEGWLLKGGYAVNHQFAQEILAVLPEQIAGSAPVWTLADGELLPVQAAGEFSLGIMGQPRAWLLDLEIYRKRVRGLSAITLGLGELADLPLNGRSRATGMDLLIKRRWQRWRAWAIYSLSQTEWQFPAVATGYFPAEHDRRHQLRLMTTFTDGPWSLSLAWRLRSGGRYTEVTDVRAVKGERGGVLIPQTEDTGINASRLPGYHRLDLSLFHDWGKRNRKGLSGRIGFSLLNVYGRQNFLDRRFLVRERTPSREEPGRFFLEIVERTGLRFTPNLRASVGWNGSRKGESPPADR